MDYREKAEVLNKIIAGGFYYEVSGLCYFIDLLLSKTDKVYLDYLYNKSYKELISEDVYTEKDYLEICIEDGRWNDKKDEEIKDLQKQIDMAKKKYYVNFYNATQKKVLKKKIKEISIDMRRLMFEKISLFTGITAEYSAEKQKNRCKYNKIVKGLDCESLSNYDFLDEGFIYGLEMAINENSCTEEQIRDIARTNPWRTVWEVSKNNFGDLFGSSVGEVTEEQYILCYWSQFYDGIFAAYEKPSNDILNDDIALDVWCEIKIKEQETEANKSSAVSSTIDNCQEIFVKTDKENAEKVYDMNDDFVKSAMKRRNKIIEKEGGISEGNLLKKTGRVDGELFVKGKA